ncbi:DUF5979 domain-containing protein [Agromyces silvae]|uniref:DUF5979 domain-containing protein n=1 Tax=Agromyces silvae TaxID=3388266 RepID=UPI00280AFA16|nr:DUF5979 domain-containing protein [Agromyces protaetiae]
MARLVPHAHAHAHPGPVSRRPRSRRPVLRRVGAVLAALALTVTSAVMLPAAAVAAPNPAIVVGDVTVTSADGGQATVGDTLTVSGTWDATTADPHEGDTFTIGLPVELAFGQAVPFALTGPNPSGTNVTWANCLTDPATGIATCTLTSEVALYPELVQGTFEFDVQAVRATTEEQVVFNLNGSDVLVDLPGTGGIDDGIVIPDDWTKSGALNDDKWSMSWTIELPGARLAGQDVVNILEDVSDNHQLCDPSNLKVETVRGSTVVDVTSIAATSTEVADPYDFSIVLTAPDGGFDPGVTYRISYDTCTPDGQIDPQGTEYLNEATVDIWGETSGVIGVEQDWAFSGLLNKQGSVLGGANRNGVIQWTVTVAGDHLVGKDGFTFSDLLTGAHELCVDSAGGYTVRALSVEERYGPSQALTRSIGADLLGATAVSLERTSFTIDFDVVAGSGFEFRASDYLYVIRYQTCANTDGLPEAGTAFGNAASVDGAIDGGEATVPGRSEGKGGRINTAPVELDGVTYLPQTTLGWTITVPGEEVAEVGGPLTVTDTLTGAHEVCAGSGGDLVDRLGLRVEARDQISGGGLATVDLTESAAVALVEGQIIVTIPQPTLALPGGSSATGFSREYQYVVSYATCTTSGGMDAPGTTYGNAAEVAGNSYTQSVTQNNRGSGTGTGVTRGSVAIVKSLADTPGAAFVPENATFSVHVKEIDPTGAVQIEYDLQLPIDGAPVSGPNSRGTGWTVELSEPTFPTIPGVVFGAPVFAETDGVTVSEDGTVATAALVPASNIAVSLTNSAELGAAEIVKTVEGPAAGLVDADREFSMTAAIDVTALGAGFPAQPDRQFAVTAGETYVLEDLPIGATVTFSETQPTDDDVLTWSEPVIEPGSIQVLPAHLAEPVVISVTNTVERTVGTFALSKTVTGDEAENPAVPAEVTVTATWDEEGTPGSTTLTLPTDGTSVPFGADLLVGTEVTLTETPLVNGSGIAWGAPVWSGTGVELAGESAIVTIGRDASAAVALQNHAATSTAGISLLKGIGGEAAGEVDPDAQFPVTATWTDAEGVEQSRDLLIGALEPTSLGEELPAGTVVTITEGDRPEIDTVVWGSIVISGERVEDAGDGSATVVVSDLQDDVTLVTVVNEATWAPGTFSISKDVTGIALDHPDVPESVLVVATWLDDEEIEQSRELTVPTDGTVVDFGEVLPHLTEVTLTEVALADAPSFTWAAPQWAGTGVVANEDGTATLTIGAATVAEVELTNAAIASTGQLVLTKALTGAGAAKLPADRVFPVTATWTDLLGEQHERRVELKAGASATLEELPLGVEVRLVEGETERALPGDVRWTGVSWASDDERVRAVAESGVPAVVVTVSAEPGASVALTATNDYEVIPGLASTGLDLGPWQATALLGGVLALAAGAWLLVRRRRSLVE